MPNDEFVVARSAPTDAEVGPIVRRLAAAYEANLRFRMRELHETAEEADHKVRQVYDEDRQHAAFEEASDQVSWFAISSLVEADPEAGWGIWERVKAKAAEELASGHRAAQALDWDNSPWGRAQFLAIRQAFVDEWQPTGSELLLVDQMAHAHSLYLYWIERAQVQACLEASSMDKQLHERGRWKPRQISAAESLDQSAQMAERWQRLFVRALRALRDLRRHAPPVVLAGPGSQVNVGHQQVNTVGAVDEPHPTGRDRSDFPRASDEAMT